MKKEIILLIFLFFSKVLFSQPTFERKYDYNGNADLARDVVEIPNGHFIIVGATGPTNNPLGLGNTDGLVIKINSVGDTLWTRTFGDYGTDALLSVLFREDKIIIVGVKFVFGKAHQGWLLQLDPNGNKLLEKTYGGNNYAFDGIARILPTNDGGYIMFGTTESYGTNGTKDAWLIKLDSNFDTLWTKTYDLGVITGDSSYDDNGISFTSIHNDKFILAINTCTAECNSADPRVYASYLVVDSLGNLIKHFSIKKGRKNKFQQINPTSDGGAIITGATSIIDSAVSWVPLIGNMRSEDIWVLKLDANADTVWSRIIGKYAVYDGGFSVFQRSDETYILSAYSQIGDTPQMDFDNYWLMKLNSSGDTLWVRKYGGPENDDMYSVISSSDGGIIAVGWRDANSVQWEGDVPGPADVWVIKTDDEGLITSVEQSPIYFKDFILDQNYPNPFNPSTTIRFSIPHREHVTLKVFDVLGREAATLVDEELNPGEHSLVFDAKGLPSGVYFYRLQAGNFVEQKKMVAVK